MATIIQSYLLNLSWLHFFPLFIPFSSIFFHTLCPPRSLILTHTQVFSFFLFLFVGGVSGWTEIEAGKERNREILWVRVIGSEGGKGGEEPQTGEKGVKMRESFLSCLSDPASQPVIQSISQTEAVFFLPPRDVLYLAGVLLQLGIKPWVGDRTDNKLTHLMSKFDCAQTLHK